MKGIDRPAFSILISPDSQLILDEIDDQLKRFNINGDTLEKLIFWGDVEPNQKFWNSLNQEGLFSSFRIIIVRNANLWNSHIWESIYKSIIPPKKDVWLFLCLDAEFEKGKFKLPSHIQKSKCMSYALKNRNIWSAQKLSGTSLKKYIEKQARMLNLHFAPQVFQSFYDSVLPDAAAISNELKKLSLIAKSGIITEELLYLDTAGMESDAFGIIKKLESGNLSSIWIEINKSNANTLLFYLIALLAREFRLFWQLLNGGDPWIAPGEIEVKRNIAKYLQKDGISSGFCMLSEAEWQVKSGKLSPEQALEILIINMNNLLSMSKKSK